MSQDYTKREAISAEQQLLGHLLYAPYDFSGVAQTVYVESFFLDRHREIYAEMQRQYETHGGFEAESIETALQTRDSDALDDPDGGNYLLRLMGEASVGLPYSHFVEQLDLAHWRRQTMRSLSEVAALNGTYTDADSYMHQVATITGGLFSAFRENRPTQWIRGVDVISEKYSALMYGTQANKSLRTGIQSLDRVLAGGFRRKTHSAVLAISGTGKTNLLKQVALQNVRDGHHVVYIMMEEDEDFLVSLMLAEMLKINPIYVQQDEVPPDPACHECRYLSDVDQYLCGCRERYADTYRRRFKQVLAKWMESYQDLLTVIPKVVHVDRWLSEVRDIHRLQPIDALYVDFGQMVAYDGRDGNQEQERFANSITQAAMEMNAVAITALQVRKEGGAGMSRPPTINDIRGTSAWYNTCRNIIAIYRPQINTDEYGNAIHDVNGTLNFVKKRSGFPSAKAVPVRLMSNGLYFAMRNTQGDKNHEQ